MKKRLLLVLALIAALSLVAAAPVSAGGEKPINGKMDLTLEDEFCGTPLKSPLVTWLGTVVIDGTTYGWADFPTELPDFETKLGFMLFKEYWTIFDLNGKDPTVALACDPTLVVLDGYNDGRGTPGGAARADGTVANQGVGPFAAVAPESRMIWRGKVTNFKEARDEFKATLHIFPLK